MGDITKTINDITNVVTHGGATCLKGDYSLTPLEWGSRTNPWRVPHSDNWQA